MSTDEISLVPPSNTAKSKASMTPEPIRGSLNRRGFLRSAGTVTAMAGIQTLLPG